MQQNLLQCTGKELKSHLLRDPPNLHDSVESVNGGNQFPARDTTHLVPDLFVVLPTTKAVKWANAHLINPTHIPEYQCTRKGTHLCTKGEWETTPTPASCTNGIDIPNALGGKWDEE
ncbi:unnamed protein product, partial [Timema podura]|nr:unnamed protein product [Timema podura]